MKIISDAIIESIAKELGEITTGSLIKKYIANHPVIGFEIRESTKWKILRDYFECIQKEYPKSLRLDACLEHFYNPALYIQRADEYSANVKRMNEVLAFVGVSINAKGKIIATTPAETISQAKFRAQSLLKKVEERGMHAKIKQYCREDLLRNDYYDVVYESVKGIYEHIREITDCHQLDGQKLISKVFSADAPWILINSFQTESDKSEHKGFVNLLIGLHGHFRNPAAHQLKQSWAKQEVEVLEILAILSYVHRRLDNIQITCYAHQQGN